MNKVKIAAFIIFITTLQLSASSHLSKQSEPRYMSTKKDDLEIKTHQENFEKIFAEVQPDLKSQINQEQIRRNSCCLLRILSYPCKIFCIRNGYISKKL